MTVHDEPIYTRDEGYLASTYSIEFVLGGKHGRNELDGADKGQRLNHLGICAPAADQADQAVGEGARWNANQLMHRWHYPEKNGVREEYIVW